MNNCRGVLNKFHNKDKLVVVFLSEQKRVELLLWNRHEEFFLIILEIAYCHESMLATKYKYIFGDTDTIRHGTDKTLVGNSLDTCRTLQNPCRTIFFRDMFGYLILWYCQNFENKIEVASSYGL